MRSVVDIFREYGILDPSGRHVGGTDKETNHRYGEAYERLFTKGAVDNLCGWSGGIRHCSECESDTSHWWYCPKFRGLTMRRDSKLMMEVGVADGSSLLAWSEVFPKATCVGLDIHHSDRAHGDRIEFHLGDQRSKADCVRAAGGRLFDLIVDDATHEIDATLLTLYWLWPFVRPGGLYVVEEWPTPDHDRILGLFPCAELVDTVGPFGGLEPLVVLRK